MFFGSKPVTSPMKSNLKLTSTNGVLLYDALDLELDNDCPLVTNERIASSTYHKLIGRLLYLTNTCLDISLAVQQLSQFMSAPTNHHFKHAQRVLKYIKKSPSPKLFFPKSSSLSLQLKTHSNSN